MKTQISSSKSKTRLAVVLLRLLTASVLAAQAPTVSFTAAPSPGCISDEIQFTYTGTTAGVTSKRWTFPGGQPANSTDWDPVAEWPTAGTYTVSLSVTFGTAGTTVKTQTITIHNGVPAPDFTHQSLGGNELKFAPDPAGSTGHVWDFGDGNTSSAASPTHTYAEPGIYDVTISKSNGCGMGEKTRTVYTAPVAGFAAAPTEGCAPMTVLFSNASLAATEYRWDFPGGLPDYSEDESPEVEYAEAGQHMARLIASNPAGKDTFEIMVDVRGAPEPDFAAQVMGDSVVFSNLTKNAAGSTFAWYFGDGAASTDETPNHVYAKDGLYTVELVADNACGSETFSKDLEILTPPEAGFTVSGLGPLSAPNCAPDTVKFHATASSYQASFLWAFPGGLPATSTEASPTVIYASGGAFKATLIVSNPLGSDTLTRDSAVVLRHLPTANFAAAANNLTVSFSNTSANATQFAWDFGDGQMSTEQHPTHTYAAPGTYDAILVATGICGSSSTVQHISVSTLPTASFAASNTGGGCAPMTIAFANYSTGAASFAWQFPGGLPATSMEQNPVVVYQNPGTYEATLIVSNATGSDTLTQTVAVIFGQPTANFTAATAGATVSFSNTSANATQFAWNFGDGQTSTEQHPTHTYAAPGTYTIVLTVAGQCGSATATQSVVILAAPVAAFSPANFEGCAPMSVAFHSASTGDQLSFAWQFPGGLPATSTEENPVVVYQNPGTYEATLTVSNPAGSSTLTQTAAIVLEQPVANFSVAVSGATASFSNTSVGTSGSQMTWYFGDGTSSSEANPTHTYAASGVYQVLLQILNGSCEDEIQQPVSIVISAASEVFGKNADLRVFPNPTEGAFTVEMLGETEGEIALKIMDATGKILRSTVEKTARFEVPAGQLAPGIYWLQAQTGGRVFGKKLIVQ